jgi:hypothetical protein
MPRFSAHIVVAILAAAPALGADDPLARARQLYNERNFAAAVELAEQARELPGRADSADLVAARAYLERYRDSGASEDLTSARDRLRRLDPEKFGPRERAEYVVGLGETLFFDGAFGAAATVFDSVLQSRDALADAARERVLDWWATAVDREAKPRSEMERQGVYLRIRSRMDEELAAHPSSATAIYWIAAAARSQGDHQGAWDAAQAGWVRARLVSDKGEGLRADLDRLVQRAIVPDRARATAQSPDLLRAEWERFKESWR